MKTMAIRLEDELHSQLSVIATLEGQTVTDIIRASILAYIEARKDALASKAEAALEEIEREAEARRQAIAAMFGKAGATNGGETAAPEGDASVGSEDEQSSEPTGSSQATVRPLRGRKGGSES
jgi:predicted DNA-binding protein